ncbi:unnamed protein product [Clavelina lepadiformis]|uniref:Uncharacterized protein n=1 Tax=Clavelina lepadiformis TaxID=159417 RepID=A0ABP0FYW3_CLALP
MKLALLSSLVFTLLANGEAALSRESLTKLKRSSPFKDYFKNFGKHSSDYDDEAIGCET